MHQRYCQPTFLLALMLLWLPLFCQAGAQSHTVFLLDEQTRVPLAQAIRYYEDVDATLTIEKVLGAHNTLDWHSIHSESDTLSFGYTTSTYWLHTQLNNASKSTLHRLLEIGYPVLDHVEVYTANGMSLRQHWPLGDKLPFAERPIQHHHFIIPLAVAAGDKLDIYLRVATSSSMQIPLVLWERSAFLEHTHHQTIGLGIYYGAMLVMVLYNLFVFLTVRESNYFYYVCYVASMGIFVACLNGISYQYLWPASIWWNDQSIIVSLFGVLLFGALFTNHFLRLSKYKPALSRLFLLFAGFAAACMMASFFMPYAVMIVIVILVCVMAICVAIGTGMMRWAEGDLAARYYTVAWISLLLGGLILAFNKFNLIPSNLFTENGVQFGSALEVVLLSFALADRLNTEKRRRYEAQQTALAHERVARLAQAEALEQEKQTRLAREAALRHEREAREAERHALEIQRRANETLEQRVKERTHELEIANRKLEQLTFTDGLTGINNRRFFDRKIDQEFRRAHRERYPIGVLLIDVDHFKRFNDTYGHLLGDDCLRRVAQEIAGCLFRDTDVTARYGGEEFAVILPNTDDAGTRHIAEKIRARIEAIEFVVENKVVPITVSIGASLLVPRQELGFELLIAAADDALYKAKQSGRNRVCFHVLEAPSAANRGG